MYRIFNIRVAKYMDNMQVQFGFKISFPKTTFLLLDNYSNLACESLMPPTF